MYTYKVIAPNSTYQIIEADYFSVTYDGKEFMNAFFYVTKTLKERELLSRSATPAVTQEILVGYAHNPQIVQLADNFVYQPPGSKTPTDPLDTNPWAR